MGPLITVRICRVITTSTLYISDTTFDKSKEYINSPLESLPLLYNNLFRIIVVSSVKQ